MMKKIGRSIIVLVLFVPILMVDGWKKAITDAKDYIINGDTGE